MQHRRGIDLQPCPLDKCVRGVESPFARNAQGRIPKLLCPGLFKVQWPDEYPEICLRTRKNSSYLGNHGRESYAPASYNMGYLHLKIRS